jgi:hypothetical protein
MLNPLLGWQISGQQLAHGRHRPLSGNRNREIRLDLAVGDYVSGYRELDIAAPP